MADHDGGVIKQQIPQIKMDPPSVDNSSPSPPKVSELIKGSVDIWITLKFKSRTKIHSLIHLRYHSSPITECTFQLCRDIFSSKLQKNLILTDLIFIIVTAKRVSTLSDYLNDFNSIIFKFFLFFRSLLIEIKTKSHCNLYDFNNFNNSSSQKTLGRKNLLNNAKLIWSIR